MVAVYRPKYLKENIIGIVLKNLYRNSDKPYSKSSIKWLEFIAAQTNSKILHACNGGDEKMIVDKNLGKTYYVGGFCEEKGVVYEFFNCVYHSCELCYDRGRVQGNHCTCGTVTGTRFYCKNNLEHDYMKLRQMDEMKLFLDTFDIITDLDPRDSFFGGRSVVLNYFVRQKMMKNRIFRFYFLVFIW